MDEETTKKFECPSAIVPFCFNSVPEFIALSYASVKTELSRSVYVDSVALLLTFLILFASKLISHKHPLASQDQFVAQEAYFTPGR